MHVCICMYLCILCSTVHRYPLRHVSPTCSSFWKFDSICRKNTHAIVEYWKSMYVRTRAAFRGGGGGGEGIYPPPPPWRSAASLNVYPNIYTKGSRKAGFIGKWMKHKVFGYYFENFSQGHCLQSLNTLELYVHSLVAYCIIPPPAHTIVTYNTPPMTVTYNNPPVSVHLYTPVVCCYYPLTLSPESCMQPCVSLVQIILVSQHWSCKQLVTHV